MMKHSAFASSGRRHARQFPIVLAGFIGALSFAASAAAESEGHNKKNHASVLIGGTYVPDADHTAFTLGLDLEHEITHRFGVGLVVEYAFEPIDATSLFAVVDVHLARGVVLQMGPGVEWVEHETYAVGRIGLFYEVEIGEFVVAPSVSYGISEGEDSLVFGAAIGTKF